MKACFDQASWRQRLDAALQLLRIATQLTDGVDGMRLYLTDVSLHNVAVSAKNGRLKIVDGEHIVVVDLDHVRRRAFPPFFSLLRPMFSFSLLIDLQQNRLATMCPTRATTAVAMNGKQIRTASVTVSRYRFFHVH